MLLKCIVLIFSGVLGDVIGRYALYYPLFLKHQAIVDSYETLEMSLPADIQRKPLFLDQWTRRNCCGHQSMLSEKIPFVSMINFFWSNHQCDQCCARLPFAIAVSTLLVLLLTGLIVMQYGITFKSLWLCLFFDNLIVLSLIDFAERILPDLHTVGFLWLGLLLNCWRTFSSLKSAVIAAVLGYAIPWLCASLYTLIRKKEAMGQGDFKLYAMVGAWFGLPILCHTWLLSVLLGGVSAVFVFVKKQSGLYQEIPFGPIIALATLITLWSGPFLWRL